MLNLYSLVAILAYASISFAQEPPTMPHAPPYTCTTSTTTYCQPGLGLSPSDQQYFPHQHHPNTTHDPKLTQGRPGKTGATGEKGEKGDKGDPCQCDVADEEEVIELRQKMERLEEQNRELLDMNERLLKLEERTSFLPTNCTEYRSRENEARPKDVVELYPMKTIGDMTPVMINCSLLEEMKQSNDWTVIQRRQDGSVDFFRDWKSYREGFGDKNEEFWLGLLYIHWLTAEKDYKLRIDFRDQNSAQSYAKYGTFNVRSEATNYRLVISDYSGTAGESFNYHNGHSFTTFDRDNDVHSPYNCARHRHGAWWYKGCYGCNLNGQYYKTHSGDYGRIFWAGKTMMFVEMKIRPV